METVALDHDAFRSTLATPMRNVTGEETDSVDIWPYVAAIPSADVSDLSILDVQLVYRHPANYFDHVLVGTSAKNIYLVVVVDLQQNRVHGHRLLDLNQEYSLD